MSASDAKPDGVARDLLTSISARGSEGNEDELSAPKDLDSLRERLREKDRRRYVYINGPSWAFCPIGPFEFKAFVWQFVFFHLRRGLYFSQEQNSHIYLYRFCEAA